LVVWFDPTEKGQCAKGIHRNVPGSKDLYWPDIEQTDFALHQMIEKPGISKWFGRFDLALPERGLYVLRHGGPPPLRLRLLIDFLAERFGPEPYWDPCWRKVPSGAAAVAG
jgi:hypothetical protein